MKLILALIILSPLSVTAQLGWNWPAGLKIAKDKNAEYSDYLKEKRYLEARAPHHWLLLNAPDLNPALYINGVKLYRGLVDSESNSNTRRNYIDSLMLMYDLRIRYFNKKANVLQRKAITAFEYLYNGSSDDIGYLYDLYVEVINLNKEKTVSQNFINYAKTIKRADKLGMISREDFDLKKDLILNLVEAKADKDQSYRTKLPDVTSRLQAALEVDSDYRPTAPSQKKLALVIGNANYSEGGSLRNPTNDSRDIANKLKKLDFEVILQNDLSHGSFKRLVDQFGSRLSDYDVGLFYYAGHGVQVDGTNYLIPSDALITEKSDVDLECVRTQRVIDRMTKSQVSTKIIILDACRNNPFERSWTRSSRGKGLAAMNAPLGTIIAYSTSPGKTAEDGDGDNGLYTEALLEELDSPDQELVDLFKNVRTAVIEKSNNSQTPWETSSLVSDFFFDR